MYILRKKEMAIYVYWSIDNGWSEEIQFATLFNSSQVEESEKWPVFGEWVKLGQ